MKTFRFPITRDITETAMVEVRAKSIEEAHAIALTRSFHTNPANAKFEVDEGNCPKDAYLPDPNDWEEV